MQSLRDSLSGIPEMAARFPRLQMMPLALTNDLRREWVAPGGVK